MSDRVSPYGLKALLDVLVAGSGPLQSGTLKAMILNVSTTVDTELDTVATLDAFTTPAEYIEASYSRLTATCTVAVDGTEVVLDLSNLVWPTLAAGANTPAFILVYVQKSGAAIDPALTDRVPLVLLDASFTPDGTNFTYVVPVDGLVRIETAAA